MNTLANAAKSAAEIREGIAKAIANHLWMNAAMDNGTAPEQDENTRWLEVAQVALQTKDVLIPGDPTMTEAEWAADSRAFLVECGMTESFARRIITNDQPKGIY